MLILANDGGCGTLLVQNIDAVQLNVKKRGRNIERKAAGPALESERGWGTGQQVTTVGR